MTSSDGLHRMGVSLDAIKIVFMEYNGDEAIDPTLKKLNLLYTQLDYTIFRSFFRTFKFLLGRLQKTRFLTLSPKKK
jgi:hypothetical protein